jgi:starch synthase
VALAARGWQPVVLTPAYGMFAQLAGAKQLARVDVSFARATQPVDLYEVPGPNRAVLHYVLDSELFSPQGPGLIYTDDDGGGPFATDASKFAFFCAAAASALSEGALEMPDIVHLHDWQAALFLALREFDPSYSALRKIRTVYTIHNLAMQGVRPLVGNESAFATWFPDLEFDSDAITDPRWPDCVNPMAVGIRLADAVNTVSPTYAQEILAPSDAVRGYFGGEGLEDDLREAQAAKRLVGILNGCTYAPRQPRKPGWDRILTMMRAEVTRWIARERHMVAAHYLADKQLGKFPARRPRALLTSIGRVTAQKAQLYRTQTAAGMSALEAILATIGSDSLFVLVGSGDPAYEKYFSEIAGTHDNFLFLNGYSDELADSLYAGGDLFLMPSSFEPCGISQMLAMRAGQPCVVHGVGGLKDTVTDGVTGFVFGGGTPTDQAEAFVARVAYALELRSTATGRWQRLQQAAAAARFGWAISAATYEKALYGSKTQ